MSDTLRERAKSELEFRQRHAAHIKNVKAIASCLYFIGFLWLSIAIMDSLDPPVWADFVVAGALFFLGVFIKVLMIPPEDRI